MERKKHEIKEEGSNGKDVEKEGGDEKEKNRGEEMQGEEVK